METGHGGEIGGGFYLPENPRYTVVDSARDSVRFVVERALTRYQGHWRAKGSFLDPDGEVMDWHEFGHLEGPGWAANAVGGAHELFHWGRLMRDTRVCSIALSIVDHVLDDGFIDWDTGFMWPYRHTQTDVLCLNYTHTNDWFCPGSQSKVAYQIWRLAPMVGGARGLRLHRAARAWADWLTHSVKLCANGWLPRRCARDGTEYCQRPGGADDPFFDTSADGLYAIQLLAELGAETGDYHPWVDQLSDAFWAQGGIFGSINHDTYNPAENVAYSVAFRVFRRLAELRNDSELARNAYAKCLAPLDDFKITEDRNGVPTKGLLWMEKSWDTCYLWENAEAALAYLEAYGDTGDQRYLADALTILRAIAKHHHGDWGFVTEGVDWNNHVGQQHHFDEAEFGDIRYTEPLLNHLHHLEPLCAYLSQYSRQQFTDFEGNSLLAVDVTDETKTDLIRP